MGVDRRHPGASLSDGPQTHRIWIGCSGWNYEHWRGGVFYPQGVPARNWLEYYASRYDSVEVNSTFYRLPRREAVQRWAEQTPEGFVFAVKVSRYITHVKRLRETGSHLERLLERIGPLTNARKLGPLLWQLPPTLKRDEERLAGALADFPPTLRHAVEFRHPSWFTRNVMELLRAHRVALVIAHRPEIASFQSHEVTADLVYVRLHHGARGRAGNYSPGELGEWAGRIRRWREEGDVYVYFNNDWEGIAPANAGALESLLRRSG